MQLHYFGYTNFSLYSTALCKPLSCSNNYASPVSLSMPVPMYRANKYNRHLKEYFSSLKYDSNLSGHLTPDTNPAVVRVPSSLCFWIDQPKIPIGGTF